MAELVRSGGCLPENNAEWSLHDSHLHVEQKNLYFSIPFSRNVAFWLRATPFVIL